jgi:hypothetical protein
VSGCARQVGPCAAYAGIRDELAAIASQQRTGAADSGGSGSAGGGGGGSGGGFQVVIDIFNTPPWAARSRSGCQPAGAEPTSQAPTKAALSAYRALIRSLLALATREGVRLEWWSAWNEPNNPVFLSPQRGSCDTPAPLLAAARYAELARVMAAELRADGGQHHLLLGELSASSNRASISEFVGALPDDVMCLGEVWSVHAYASVTSTPAVDPVSSLQAALDARGGCARGARIWVTETGAGAPHPGSPRRALAAGDQAGCRALGAQLRRWYRDPRVGAVFPYTFREDPAYPVGLIGPELSRPYPTYRLWLAWSRLRAAGEQPPSPVAGCR